MSDHRRVEIICQYVTICVQLCYDNFKCILSPCSQKRGISGVCSIYRKGPKPVKREQQCKSMTVLKQRSLSPYIPKKGASRVLASAVSCKGSVPSKSELQCSQWKFTRQKSLTQYCKVSTNTKNYRKESLQNEVKKNLST